MGFIAERNVNVLAKEASEARQRGEHVFVTVLHSAAVGGEFPVVAGDNRL